jgi:hypothetical protein
MAETDRFHIPTCVDIAELGGSAVASVPSAPIVQLHYDKTGFF